jgi:hypothetical protein
MGRAPLWLRTWRARYLDGDRRAGDTVRDGVPAPAVQRFSIVLA